ncbi:hypothetical protein CJD36_016745 [Flavipsychrobacter stenotrophus]|uniref:Uncharacterized protein n=1 Tax=Flavipsychrobacter stenotrophus TaxID=2077091 RepID=A0A2S7SSK6_9BACT|nr:hypothetical protein [Flavipsychrobacter stenotrophus]PQJ09587.1 hypothetical protein CJD36_016745 [Flavipsychrobacter stenotrophus]
MKSLKVTFDKNVYEFVVAPEKQALISDNKRNVFRKINQLIHSGMIEPFISETILTYEVLTKKIRQEILSNNNPIIATSNGPFITIGSNPQIHPGNSIQDDVFLPMAIDSGFKILPDRRFGKLTNPAIKPEWYYLPDEDFFAGTERFSKVINEIDKLDVGYKAFQIELGLLENSNLKPHEAIQQYKGSPKKLSALISERSDGDSLALHISNQLDFFCTYDKGISAKKSVFNEKIIVQLKDKFSFLKGTPEELIDLFG